MCNKHKKSVLKITNMFTHHKDVSRAVPLCRNIRNSLTEIVTSPFRKQRIKKQWLAGIFHHLGDTVTNWNRSNGCVSVSTINGHPPNYEKSWKTAENPSRVSL